MPDLVGPGELAIRPRSRGGGLQSAPSSETEGPMALFRFVFRRVGHARTGWGRFIFRRTSGAELLAMNVRRCLVRRVGSQEGE